MTPSGGVLAVIADRVLRDEVDRVAAAVGVQVVHSTPVASPSRRAWHAAAAVVLDDAGARCYRASGLPRRPQVVLLVGTQPDESVWRAAVDVGAQAVLRVPGQQDDLVAVFSDARDAVTDAGVSGSIVAVIGGGGGAGASVFSAALAMVASDALLVDVDPWGGGIDLLLGSEHEAGVRWPDLALQSGRLNLVAVRDAVPNSRGIGVLSGTRRDVSVAAGPLLAIIDAGRRGGATVICDLPRRMTEAVETALESADLVVLIGRCDVRSCASLAAMAPTLVALNPNVGLVVRGPAPGGLRSAEVARIAGLPLLSAMRPQPGLAASLEHGGLRLRRRSPLAVAARRVLTVLDRHPVTAVA